jgi:hypothetical protein
MRLLADFVYEDPSGERWVAPRGAIVDGASIPRVLWSLIGGPFEGKYRDASVVHDIACEERRRPWRDVHRMFYNASRLAGVEETRARVMYGAVFHFGPRWAERGIRTLTTEADFDKMETYIREHPNTSLEDIEKLTRARLQ